MALVFYVLNKKRIRLCLTALLNCHSIYFLFCLLIVGYILKEHAMIWGQGCQAAGGPPRHVHALHHRTIILSYHAARRELPQLHLSNLQKAGSNKYCWEVSLKGKWILRNNTTVKRVLGIEGLLLCKE